MDKRMIFILIWIFVFALGVNLIASIGLIVIETTLSILGYENISEMTWHKTCYSASFYISIGFMMLGAVLGFKGWLPGTGFDKDNPYAFAGESERSFARKLLQVRCENITYLFLFKDGIKSYIYTFLLFLLFIFMAFYTNSKGLAIFASGGLAGFLWRDWTELFRTKTLWPFKMKIIDWEKVQHLAKETDA